MTWPAALTLAVPALVAILGYFASYQNNLRLAKRKDHLDRVTRQLADLYGPLFALSSAAESAWLAFRRQHRPDAPAYWSDPPPSDDEAAAWRLWMTTVFMPLNRRMRDTVIAGAHLLDEEEMPSCLIELSAHVAAYEAVLDRWKNLDFAEHHGALNFPSEVKHYATVSFKRLKAEQARLLRLS